MRKRSVISVITLMTAAVLLTSCAATVTGYSASGSCRKLLPTVRPDYTFIMPCGATILSEKDIAHVLAEGRRSWTDQLAPMRADLDRYRLWDAAGKLWAITERAVRGLIGRPFPSREEALRSAYYLMDGLIASGVAILHELIKRQGG